MESTFDWGMAWILALQEAGGPFFETLFKVVTFTGEEMFYLLFVPILFWAIDHRIGARVGFAFLISAYVNPILKDLFPQPRPYEVNPAASDLTVPGSGMPSGHAQSSVFVWGTLAAQFGRRWFWIAAIIWMFLVGLSRVYLGVHFPHQVIAGWLAGAILLTLFLFLDPRLESWLGSLPLGQQLLLAVGVPAVLALGYPHNDTVASAAVMCGFGGGFALMRRYVRFSATGLWWQRVVRTAIGLAALLGLYIAFSAVFPDQGEISDAVYYGLRFVRYGLLGVWISLGAPWLFSILRLVEEPEAPVEAGPAIG